MDLSGTAGAAIFLIRVFSSHDVPAEDVRVAQTQAQAILREAGAAVAWINCGDSSEDRAETSPQCTEPLHSNDLVLRLQAAPRPAAGPDAVMGFALIDPNGGYLPFLATVYTDRVAAMARRAGVNRRPLLARAVAHEIGHLLLNDAGHAERGLMRSAWSAVELRRNAKADWMFLASEAEAIRAVSAVRAAAS